MGLSKAFLVTKQDVSKSKLPKQNQPLQALVHTLTPTTHTPAHRVTLNLRVLSNKLPVNFTTFSKQCKPPQSCINTWAGKTMFRILSSDFPFLPWVMASTWLKSLVFL